MTQPSAHAMTETRIQAMTPEDLDEVLAIEEASYSLPWKRSMFETELRNPFARPAALREGTDKAIRGYVCFWLVFDELHIMNLTVRPDSRRRGIGERLSKWMLARGKEAGARLATLEARASNAAAIQLYEKLGFRRSAVRSGYYREPREDAMIMELTEWP